MQPGMSSEDLRAILSRYESWAAKQPGDGNGNGNGHKNGKRAEEAREIPYEEAIRQYRTRRARGTPKATPMSGAGGDADVVPVNLRSIVEANVRVETEPEAIQDTPAAKAAASAETANAGSTEIPCKGVAVPGGQPASFAGAVSVKIAKAKPRKFGRVALATSQGTEKLALVPASSQEEQAEGEVRPIANSQLAADAPKSETRTQKQPTKKAKPGPGVSTVSTEETAPRAVTDSRELTDVLAVAAPQLTETVKLGPPACASKAAVGVAAKKTAVEAANAAGVATKTAGAAVKGRAAKRQEFRQMLAKNVQQGKRSVVLKAVALENRAVVPVAIKKTATNVKSVAAMTKKAAAAANKKTAFSPNRKFAAVLTNKAAMGQKKQTAVRSIKAATAVNKHVEPDRDRRITTRFSATEQRRIEKHAAARGLTVSAYLRQCALSGGTMQTAAARAGQEPKARSGKRNQGARQGSSQPTLFAQPAQSGLGGWLTLLRRRFLSSPMRFSEQA